jgi:N-methylhydantoinase A
VLCALGDATTSARSESARTVLRRFADLTSEDLAALLHELATDAGARLAEQGVPEAEQTTTFQVDVRYHGQGFEIPVEVTDLDGDALATLATAFDAEHERLFSFLLGADHELVNARATVSGPRPQVAATHLPDGDGDPAAALVDTHPIHVSGERVDARVYDRPKLRAGDVVAGPAIVVEMDSTTLVLPGHAATVHPSGSLLIRPEEDR